jgi:AcrR family transcriptional regulator
MTKHPYHHGSLRTALLEAAETVLEQKGIGALTLRAAARGAGVSHAAPSHHFGDLSGLLSELAASGFVRLGGQIRAEMEAAGSSPKARVMALGRAYVRFARASPGLFLLMFRSERLDWSSPTLSAAGASTFALLTQSDAASDFPFPSLDPKSFASATARWSLIHGLSTLLVDGRLAKMSERVPGVDLERLIEEILARGLGSNKA